MNGQSVRSPPILCVLYSDDVTGKSEQSPGTDEPLTMRSHALSFLSQLITTNILVTLVIVL